MVNILLTWQVLYISMYQCKAQEVEWIKNQNSLELQILFKFEFYYIAEHQMVCWHDKEHPQSAL